MKPSARIKEIAVDLFRDKYSDKYSSVSQLSGYELIDLRLEATTRYLDEVWMKGGLV